MPNRVVHSRARKLFEWICMFVLLFVFVPIKIRNNDKELYETYLRNFNKTLSYQQGFQAFRIALQHIENLNKNRTKGSAVYGLTKFSDWLPEDFFNSHFISNITPFRKLKYKATDFEIKHEKVEKMIEKYVKTYNLPLKVDWRKRKAVTKVLNQKACGACWAFAVIGVVESTFAIRTGVLEDLSIQEMIDCNRHNGGCEGGDICLLLGWLKNDNVTIVKETEYSLSLTKGNCKRGSSVSKLRITDFDCENFVDDEGAMLTLLAQNGPLAVAINAQSWQNYVGGTIQFHCDGSVNKMNHAVQIVGYDLTDEVPYYIVKNSWGEDFGEEGYLYIAIGGNICGIANEVAVIQSIQYL